MDRIFHLCAGLVIALGTQAAHAQGDAVKKGAEKPACRTQEETLRSLVYQLRYLSRHEGWFECFGGAYPYPTCAEQLVAAGPQAIPYLVEVLEWDAPTRGLGWEHGFYPTELLLRQQDIAIKCLERIIGCSFYEERHTRCRFYTDEPKYRESAIANISEWWARSKGADQAQMIRNQLELMDENISLTVWARAYALDSLTMLEGPEEVIPELRKLAAKGPYGPRTPVMEVWRRADLREPVLMTVESFWKDEKSGIDYYLLYRYGDKKIYEEIARRIEDTERPGGAFRLLGHHAWGFVKYGKNWAIPLLGKMLEQTQMTGSRLVGKHYDDQPYCNADIAAEHFQVLTGKNFGYKRDGKEEERLAAIKKAHNWWLDEGKKTLTNRIAEDHPPVEPPGDLFLSDEELAAKVSDLDSDDEGVRRKAVASLGEVYSYQIQRALLNGLAKEDRPSSRQAILKVLLQRPKLWHLPAVTRVFEEDPDLGVRVLAGEVIKKTVGDKTNHLWWDRFETREISLSAARRLAQDKKTSGEIRNLAVGILLVWDSRVDWSLLQSLASDPFFEANEKIQSHVQNKKERLKGVPKPPPLDD